MQTTKINEKWELNFEKVMIHISLNRIMEKELLRQKLKSRSKSYTNSKLKNCVILWISKQSVFIAIFEISKKFTLNYLKFLFSAL